MINYSVIQIGARHHYAVPRTLEEHGLLDRFFTDGCSGAYPNLANTATKLNTVFKSRFVERWISRDGIGVPRDKIVSFEALGLKHAISRRMDQSTNTQAEVFCRHARELNLKSIEYGLDSCKGIFGFNGACLEAFQYGKALGKTCVMDQTLAARSTMAEHLEAEKKQWHDWQDGLDIPSKDDERSRREKAEWQLADVILCPSEFVMNSITKAGGPEEKCRLVPYGIDQNKFNPFDRISKRRSQTFNLLFVGEVGLRKGAPYLLEALRRLSDRDVKCRLVGNVRLKSSKTDEYKNYAEFVGPVPRSQILREYAWADALILPSLFEGSATVISEAVSMGLPVICTPNAGPPPIAGITEVPLNNVPALMAAIESAKNGEIESPTPQSRISVSLDRYSKQVLAALPLGSMQRSN